jgi:pyridoxal phosphate-dependent aminotransferase EpsN
LMKKRIYLSVPHMSGGEMPFVQEAFASNWLSTVGPNVTALEAEFAELVGRESVVLSSGTAAMHLAVRLLGLKEGDEVITPTLTFAASCNPLLYERLTPVFIDSEPASWNLDPHLLAEFLKKRARVNCLPKAVTVVHLYGQSADLDPIMATCQKYGLPLIEDAAESLGARYKGQLVGSFGDAGVFSFNGNKVITGTSGGMLSSPRHEWIERSRFWASQARDPGETYLHSQVGFNYGFSNVLAGIVRAQLDVLDERISQRRAVALRYRDALEPLGFTLMPQAPHGLHTNWLSCFLMDTDRTGMTNLELIRFLKSHHIETRTVWKPMHTQKLYESYECIGGTVAEELHRQGISLPSSSSLTVDDQEIVIETIREAVNGRR